MGIEKFFNSLKKSYGAKIINKIEKSSFFPDKYLLIDFNSIIHNITQSISSSLIYLYHIYLISNKRPDIFKQLKNKLVSHIENLMTTESFVIESSINLPDISSDSSRSKYFKSIDLKNITIDDIDESFFRLFDEQNMDKYIMYKIASYLSDVINFFPKLIFLYIAIDGVPLYGKMIEQKKRRYIGSFNDNVKSTLLEYYKTDLNVDSSEQIYYNQYDFENRTKRFKFNKNKISPATTFMKELELYLSSYVSVHHKKINVVIDSYNNQGEGEKKIIFKIHQLYNDNKHDLTQITVYSPDADMILLTLLELDKCNIQIMRFDQQLLQLDIININQLKKVIINYMSYGVLSSNKQNHIIKDIVMLLTILGNDFLPRLEIINTNKHINIILDSYQSLNSGDNFIFPYVDNRYTIDWTLLKQFFINLKSVLHSYEHHKYNKTWKLESDQIVNKNATTYFEHVFNIENLASPYDQLIDQQSQVSYVNRYNIKYLQGFIWLTEYYLNHNLKYKFYYYKYEYIPTITQLIFNINRLMTDNGLQKKVDDNLNKTIILDNDYFTPIQQLIYISPYNITDIADTTLLTNKIKKIAYDYDLKYNALVELTVNDGIININEYLNCTNAYYLSKCNIRRRELSGQKYLKILSI